MCGMPIHSMFPLTIRIFETHSNIDIEAHKQTNVTF